jgi:hypothetical protein
MRMVHRLPVLVNRDKAPLVPHLSNSCVSGREY